MFSIFNRKSMRDKNNLKKEVRYLRSDIEKLKRQVTRLELALRVKEIPTTKSPIKKKWSFFK